MMSLLFASLFSVAEAVPLQLSQQGRLVDSSGTAATGNHSLTFRLYNASTGGTLLWSETVSTTFTNGYYSVVLGSDTINNPLQDSVLESGQLYVELEVDSAGPLSPRSTVTSTPFARVAGKAQSADWGGLTSVPAGLNDGDDDTVGSLSCSDGEQPVYSGTAAAWICGNPVADVDAENRIAALEALVASLQTDLATAQGTISSNTANITANTTNIANNTTNISNNSTSLSNLQGSVTSNSANITTNTANIGTNSSDIDVLEASMVDAQADINDLQTDLSTAEGNITTLQSDVTDLQSNVLDLIDVDTTWTVGATGDYANLADAMEAARSVEIHTDATLTLQLQDGVYTHSQQIELYHPQGRNLRILGNSTDASAVELYFSAGTTGLKLQNNGYLGGLAYLTLKGSGAGVGLWVDNNSTIQAHSIQVEDFTSNCFKVYRSSRLVINGDSSCVGGSNGIDVSFNSSLENQGSAHSMDISSSSSNGLIVTKNSFVNLDNLSSINNGHSGMEIYNGSFANIVSATLNNNGYMGFYSYYSNSYINTFSASNNGYGGVYISRGSNARVANGTVSGNTNAGLACYRGSYCGQSNVTGGSVSAETSQAGSGPD